MRVEARCLLDAPGIRRGQPHHSFTESHQIHAQFYGHAKVTTSFTLVVRLSRLFMVTRILPLMSFTAFDLSGRVAVVVGATSGIGKSNALGLADAGADVLPTGRRADLVNCAASEVQSRGCRSLAVPADVSDDQSIRDLTQRVIAEFGKIDILVNAAGITVRRATAEVTDPEWNRIIDTNLTGMLRACRAIGPHMIDRGYGRIINIGSLTSVVALQEVAAYGVSKAGVAALTKSLAVEWAPHGICVNAILPGVFRTALNEGLLDGTERGRELLMRTPMRRFGLPDELAGAAIFLASEAASFVTGHLLAVDGGFLASGVNQ